MLTYHQSPAGRYDWAKDLTNSINYATSAQYWPHGAINTLTLSRGINRRLAQSEALRLANHSEFTAACPCSRGTNR